MNLQITSEEQPVEVAQDYSIMLEFAKIDVVYERRAKERNENALPSLLVETSKEYLLALDKLCSKEGQSEQLLNSFFVWSFAQIFYINRFNAKSDDFAALVRLNYAVNEETSAAMLLALGLLPQFHARIEALAVGVRHPEAVNVLRRACSLVEHFSTGFRSSARGGARERRAFADTIAFRRQKLTELADRCAQVVEACVNELSIEQTRSIGELVSLLGVLRGDLQALHRFYKEDALLLCAAFFLYANPLCEEQHEASLLALLRAEGSALLDNAFNRLLLRGAESCEDAFEFLRAAEELCPRWLSFHLGKLLLRAGALRPGRLLHPPQDNLEHLAERYLDHLVRCKAEFATFWHYYAQVFDLKENVNVNLLKRAVCVNLREKSMREFLEHRDKEAVVEAVLVDVLRVEAFRAKMEFDELLVLLSFVESVAVVNALFAAMLVAPGAGTEKRLLCVREAGLKLGSQPAKKLHFFNCKLLEKLYDMQLMVERGENSCEMAEELARFVQVSSVKYYVLTAHAATLVPRVLAAGGELRAETRARLRPLLQWVRIHEQSIPDNAETGPRLAQLLARPQTMR